MSANPSSRQVVLQIDRLAISFGGLVALASVSFDVREGEIASLIGRTAPARPRRSTPSPDS